MAISALDYLQPLRSALVPVPAAQLGVCRICHGAAKGDFPLCYQCGNDASHLRPGEVLPVAMSLNRSLVHHHLRNYKDGRTTEERDRLTLRLAALLAVFLTNHGSCVGEWDYATCVPSATRSAMDAVITRTMLLHENHEPTLVTTPGTWDRQFTMSRFRLTRAVDGDRVLLLDDTYTSGASLHSAAAVLTAGGATVVGPVVLGRHVDLNWPPSADMMGWLEERRWDPARCCRCAGEVQDLATLF